MQSLVLRCSGGQRTVSISNIPALSLTSMKWKQNRMRRGSVLNRRTELMKWTRHFSFDEAADDGALSRLVRLFVVFSFVTLTSLCRSPFQLRMLFENNHFRPEGADSIILWQQGENPIILCQQGANLIILCQQWVTFNIYSIRTLQGSVSLP